MAIRISGAARPRVNFVTCGLTALVLLLPIGLFLFSLSDYGQQKSPEVKSGESRFPPSNLLYRQKSLGPIPAFPPRITNVQIVDFDRDKLPDVIACDGLRNRIFWYRQIAKGQWQENVIANDVDLIAPAHATVIDLDKDGDLDIVASVLGDLWPNDDRVGRVFWLENHNYQKFEAHVLLNDVGRVADVQGGDLDHDGDIDLVVAVFGYHHGQILWLENRGSGKFREHEIYYVPGTVHVPIADFDGDKDLDFIALVSQDDEALWGFENLGGKSFSPKKHVLWQTNNFDFGSTGLVATDLDKDGDMDLLLAAGDNLELLHHYPQPWHGCLWFENLGGWKFKANRIAHFGGTYAAAPGDLDGDGDLDVVLVSIFNDWNRKGAASVVWLENDGKQNFRTWQIASSPTHLATVACGDLNGDGRDDIVAGGLHLFQPYGVLGRITTWISR